MKRLHYSEDTGLTLIILDKGNYSIGKFKKVKTDKASEEREEVFDTAHASHFTNIIDALKELARLEANENCSESLLSWFHEHAASVNKLTALLSQIREGE
jgi:hypothetical protein